MTGTTSKKMIIGIIVILIIFLCVFGYQEYKKNKIKNEKTTFITQEII